MVEDIPITALVRSPTDGLTASTFPLFRAGKTPFERKVSGV